MTTASLSSIQAPRVFQFRLTALFVAMAWTGLISLGLRAPNAWTAAAIGIVTWLIVLSSVLLVIYRRGRTRAAATGFALFAGAFILMAGGGPIYGGWLGAPFGPLGTLLSQLFNPSGSPVFVTDPFGADPANTYLQAVCIYAVCTVLGVAGATIAQALYATQPRNPES